MGVCNQLIISGGASCQCGTLGTALNPFKGVLGGLQVRKAAIELHRGDIRHHIGKAGPAVLEGIVDGTGRIRAIGLDMLPQHLQRHAKEHARIQGASALPRVGSVGGFAVKMKLHDENGVAPIIVRSVIVPGVPVHNQVQIPVHSFPPNQGLADAGLLIRRAQNLDGTGNPEILHRMTQRHGAEYRSGPQKVMAAALPRGSLLHWAGISRVAFLRHPRQAVIFRVDPHHRMSRAIRCHKGGRHAALSALHRKAIFF